jgi:hypothetical protein
MPKKPPRPKQDIDEDVIWQGTGTVTAITEYKKKRRVKKKNPIGFIWPDAKPK